MKITTITYRQTENLGNYESKTIEATACLEESEDPDKAMIALCVWVRRQLKNTPLSFPDDDSDIPY